MLNIRQNLKFNFFLIFAFLLISIQKVNAAALACNANEIAQTFTFGGGNAWTGGSSTNNYTVGTAPNAVTLTFTNTQVSTAIAGDPSLRQSGNNANALVISGTNSPVGATLSTLALSTNRTINKLTYNVYDMDFSASGASNFRDRIVATRNGGSFPTAMTAVTPANETITLASGNARATNSANCAETDTGCNIEIQFNTTGISSASTQFLADHASGTTVQQSIGFGQYSWCLPKTTLTLRKVWVNAKVNDAVTVTATGLTSLSAVANTTSETDTGIAQGVTPGSAITIGETFTTGSSSNYTSVLSCTGNATPLSGNVLTVNAADTAIVCTQTNTRKSATITLRKSWSNAIVNDAVTVTTAGGTVNPSFASVANTANETDTGTATAVFAGETLTFSEPFSVGSAANYNASLSCTGATDTNLADGLTINAADTNIVCTYTNSRRTANLTARKTWTNGKINDAVNITTTGGLNNVNFNATANTVSETDTATAITVYAGDALTFAESFTTGLAANYTTSLACTGNATALSGNVLTVNGADTNITCTYTNSRLAQSIRVDKQWTNAVAGHTASVTTTGGTNNPTFSSTASTNTTGTAVTVYAGDVVTLPAETFGGGGSAIGYNTTVACTGGSPLASGATGRTLTITNSATATVCTYTNTKLPTITLTKISNGGVGSFNFTGNNGFANQTITTLSSGVGANGVTQRLAAAGQVTSITEAVPTGYVLMGMSCSGLGGGSASYNFATATITLNAAATAAANSISCTFTNTANGTTAFDSPVKTTRFSASSNVPTIVRGSSGTQTITLTNNGPDTATNVVAYFRPLLKTGVTIASVTAPGGACAFSSPDWVCPAVASVSNGGSFNLSVVYNTSNGSSLGTDIQGEIRVNSNEYTACGGMSEYHYSVWGAGGSVRANPAPRYGAFWVGNEATTQTDIPAGSNYNEGGNLLTAWPLAQASPTGTYLYTPVYGEMLDIYEPSSTSAAPTVDKVITNLDTAPERTVDFGSHATNTAANNRRAWQVNSCIYVPASTTISPCANRADDGAYIAVDGSVIVQQNGWTGGITQNSTTLAAGYHLITTRIVNRNTQVPANTELAPGGYNRLAGIISSAVCSSSSLDALTAQAVRQSINIIAPSTLTLQKTSNVGTDTFGFALTNTFQTTGTVSTVTAGVPAQVDGDTGTAGTQAFTIPYNGVDITINENSLPTGWTLNGATCTNAASAVVGSLAGTIYTIPAANVTAAEAFSCTFTNTKVSGYTISGTVFYDNGKNAATPHNGSQELDEQGIGNRTVRLTDCASTVHYTTTTNGAGDYTLVIPNGLPVNTTLCVEEYQQPANLVSVSGNAGDTGGSYSLAADRTPFNLALNTHYTGVDFGNVAKSQLTGTGNQTIPVGTTASYGHQFIAGTEGSVTFSTSQSPTPLLAWTSLVYLDNNCNALLDGGDTQITSAINVVADQVLCLVQKVQSPANGNNGAQDISTLSANFVYAAPSAISDNFSQPDTTIIMDSGLVLLKKVREVGSCPSTGADLNPFTTNNQALPNAFIEYQITYSNPSAGTVSNIDIHDMTPSFTTFRSAACQTTPSSVLCSVASAPSVGGVGNLHWAFTNNPVGLGAGQSGEVRFCVRVDQ